MKATTKTSNSSMNLEEATSYLKKIGEWESASKFNRETILKWANFLKDREENKNPPKKSKFKELLNMF